MRLKLKSPLERTSVGTVNTMVLPSRAAVGETLFSAQISRLSADSREIWAENKVSPTAARDGKTIVLTVPTEVLSSGDFSFSLMGVPDSGTPESVARYYFRAVRQ